MSSASVAERKIACTVCRRRKTACDKARPRCSLCVKGNFDCEYAESQHQPGLRAGYVQHLEQRVDGLEQRLSDVEVHLRAPERPLEEHQAVQPNGDVVSEAAFPHHLSTSVEVGRGIGFDARGEEALRSPSNYDSRQSHVVSNGSNLEPLSYPVVLELCKVWFRKYHRFFPVLHQPSVNQLLRTTNDYATSTRGLVMQAIVTITLQHSELLRGETLQRRQWQEQLGATLVIECIKTPSLQSVQALLILSILQYGEGRSMQSWNFLAMARRMSAHIGLAQTTNDDTAPAMSPTALRRLPTFTNTTVEDEERLRAYWMIETLDSISTIGVRYDIGHPTASRSPLLPCSDSFWAYPEPVLADATLRPYNYCSAFSLCIILAVSELSNVHSFLQKKVTLDIFEERDAWQVEAQRIDERLTAWRDEFVAAVFRLINAEYIRHERGEMDPYVVLTNCVLNTAVITLLQQRVACPEGVESLAEPWAFASNRCVYASENTAFKVRQMDEDELSICHPHLIFSIFVAARFYIVHSKALDANVPTNLHSLAFALHVCGKRWPLARIYEQIIRVAVAEYRTPVVQSTVPKEFYDLRLTTFEISDSLIEWVEGPGANISISIDAQGEYPGMPSFTPMAIDVLA